jgi:hypothetical protein
MDRRTDGRMDGHKKNRWTDRTDGLMNRWTDKWTVRQMDGQKDKMDRRTDKRLTDG